MLTAWHIAVGRATFHQKPILREHVRER